MEDNPDAQLHLCSVLIKENQVGKLLYSSISDLELSRKDPYRCVFSTFILVTALLDNGQARDTLLAASFEEHGEKISLLSKICYTLLCAHRDGFDSKIQIGFLSLLCVWLFDHPKSVKEFLSEGSNVQFLVEQITQSSNVDSIVQGLAVFLYGIIFQFNDNTESVFSQYVHLYII